MTERKIKRIIDLKKQIMDHLELEIKKAGDEIDGRNKDLRNLEISMEKILDKFQSSVEDAITFDLEFYYNTIFTLHDEIKEKKTEINLLEQELQERKEQAVELCKEKKLLEILMKRGISEMARRASKAEQNEMDFNFITRRLRDD